jgi:GNAT superfamily N-acetyltransferase
MITLTRVNSTDKDFQKLVNELDGELAIRDGKDHSFYHQYNKIDAIKYAVMAYNAAIPVGCGAIKEYEPGVMEVKRMYVPLDARGKGVATIVLRELEAWAKELGYAKCVLETGKKQPEAIALYTKNKYVVIPNYGQYKGIDNSVCFEKVL